MTHASAIVAGTSSGRAYVLSRARDAARWGRWLTDGPRTLESYLAAAWTDMIHVDPLDPEQRREWLALHILAARREIEEKSKGPLALLVQSR